MRILYALIVSTFCLAAPAALAAPETTPVAGFKDPAPAAKKAAKPAPPKKAAAPKKDLKKTAPKKDAESADAAGDDDEALPVVDTDETIALPPYPAGARVAIGKNATYELGERDTLLDVARHFRLGFVELRAANPHVDPWTPVPGETVLIPHFRLLPRTPQSGVVVNLAQMRLYHFRGEGRVDTFPIGIGREGLLTPVGQTTVISKQVNPVWIPTDRMREEKPYLPRVVPAGPDNPLGTRALYLGWPEYRIHGSNKPWAIGRRVSSGCMRMYPEDIIALYDAVPVGTKVTVVEQPILVGWVGDSLYLEVNPSKSQNIDIEINGTHEVKGMTPGIRKVIEEAAGRDADRIDWGLAARAVEERLGYPVEIANLKGPVTAAEPEAPQEEERSFVPAASSTYNR